MQFSFNQRHNGDCVKFGQSDKVLKGRKNGIYCFSGFCNCLLSKKKASLFIRVDPDDDSNHACFCSREKVSGWQWWCISCGKLFLQSSAHPGSLPIAGVVLVGIYLLYFLDVLLTTEIQSYCWWNWLFLLREALWRRCSYITFNQWRLKITSILCSRSHW